MSRLELPDAPQELKGPVKAWSQPVPIPTYAPLPADRNPMFLDRRVYQGSSGRVYPLPFVDRMAEERVERAWQAIHLENEYLRVMVLPELGGRIHVLRDRSTGCDLVYRQDVIRPALVGLAGPWVSGGIELNWPQHHRPATAMPTEVCLEPGADGSWTAWFSDHDPMNRLKGMHGVRLCPGDARMELRVRLYNRTPLVQTFLWWANAAIEVHEDYQSFFPPDVRLVADHARRAVSTFPRCDGTYYGVDYAGRARDGVPEAERPRQFVPRQGRPPDDLSWYANIPVPTSYMAIGSSGDFVGGYDHAAGVGIVHVADHHIAPGKKQWTWGNQDFGYSWDRNLTEPDERGVYRPYIEIMAGVYTDNQPDFSFLGPGETRAFTQVWYPIHGIGPARQASRRGALSLSVAGGVARLGVSVPVALERVTVRLSGGGRVLAAWTRHLLPAQPMVEQVSLPPGVDEAALRLEIVDAAGREVLAYQAGAPAEAAPVAVATEPPAPRAIASADELYLTGIHLEQYRHATRSPEPYWREALRRDPLDSRCNTALGFWRLRRGEFAAAEEHFGVALRRLQLRNANPEEGKPFYGRGLALRFLGREAEAAAAFAKGTWNAAWAGPCHHALAELSCARAEWGAALEHVCRAIACDADNLRARDLEVVLLRRLGREAEASVALAEVLARDPLDALGRHLAGWMPPDAQLALDVALDLARAGLDREARTLLERAPGVPAGSVPLVHYCAAWLADRMGEPAAAARHRQAAAGASPDLCFPARLEEIGMLEAAMAAVPRDPRAPYYLGNLLYDRGRREEAVALWERAVELDPSYPVAWRNLGMAWFNVRRDPARALAAYDRARAADPSDARLLYERDQLRKRAGGDPAERLAELEAHLDLVERRDDLTVELCALLIRAGRPGEALRRLTGRRFQPWEGGEGLVLEQHTRARLALARQLRDGGDLAGARSQLEAALRPPESLGEIWHPLASASDVLHALGDVCEQAGEREAAHRHFAAAAGRRGDFRSMSVQAFSPATYWSALALGRLGRSEEKDALLRALEEHASALLRTEARIDYFATSLPTMLLFEDDLQQRQEVSAHVMLAQARLGQGDGAGARRHLREALRRDPSHGLAGELARQLGEG